MDEHGKRVLSVEVTGPPEAMLAMYAELAERLSKNLHGLALEANALALQLRAVRHVRKRRRFRFCGGGS